MRALLEAKKQRTRQGPSWPSGGAHTGVAGGHEAGESHGVDETPGSHPAPASNLGVVGMHGRGNQGKRGQR